MKKLSILLSNISKLSKNAPLFAFVFLAMGSSLFAQDIHDCPTCPPMNLGPLDSGDSNSSDDSEGEEKEEDSDRITVCEADLSKASENGMFGPAPSFFVGPNPTNGVLNISQTNTEIQITLIEVFDVQGRMIAQFEDPQQQFSVSELPSGLLFVRMTSTNTSTKERYLETKQIVSAN